MDKFLDKLRNTKILGICGSILIAIGTFLPIATTSILGMTQTYSYVQLGGDGILVFVMAIVSLLLIFADKLEKIIPIFAKVKNPKYTLISTCISAILLIVTAINITSNANFRVLGVVAKADLGFAFWVIWIGIVLSIIYPFLYKDNKDNKNN